MPLRDESLDIDRLRLQWRNANRHSQRHETINFGSGLPLAGFAVAGVVEGNHRMADTHRKDRVPAVCEIAVKKNLLEIPQCRAPAPNQVDL